MAKKTTKRTTKKTTKKTPGGGTRSRGRGTGFTGSLEGRNLVIVESPAKAKTINRYLGDDFVVLASVGHVRDLPSKNPKGVKSPVPGVDLEHRFAPTYETLPGKDAVLRDLKKFAKQALKSGGNVWLATDLDREGEAIAWHLAQEMGIEPDQAKRVIFAAITKADIKHAFENPHSIDTGRVQAWQARRILDRIVGYQVSPLLWKKVARGLSAGRVQSVAVRLVVEREREIRSFVPDEYWQVNGVFALETAKAAGLVDAWQGLRSSPAEGNGRRGEGPTVREINAWLAQHGALRAELIEVGGQKPELTLAGGDGGGFDSPDAGDLSARIAEIMNLAGMDDLRADVSENASGKGPARWTRTITGTVDPSTPYRVRSIETKRTKARPGAPFITSTMQQAASTRLGFAAVRTMRAAQQLYEGVEIPGEGPVGLITYMRTDSTHLAADAVHMVRAHIEHRYGPEYLPEKPNFYSSSNKDAQEAHEAIRPASLAYPPSRVKKALTADQHKLYLLIWDRFVSCQMTPAQWDSTAVVIEGGRDASRPVAFRATGRTLAFDGFYACSGVPTASDEATLPALEEGREVSPFAIEPVQKFTQPPARYTEASLIKVLEAEGIGRPSTYADIIGKIQQRKYVEQIQRRFFSTDLGEVVTDKLVEAFPHIMDVGYTRQMESELDKVEDDHIDWVEMLQRFYGPFREDLDKALETLTHARAETQPAPEEYRCGKCSASLVYRFGRNGRFLSCSRYPDCEYACPCDREGKPLEAEFVNVRCPKTGRPMIRRTGRFGPFLATHLEDGEAQDAGMILNIDKKGHVVAPAPPPLLTDLPCSTCESPLNLRSGVRGPWLGCSRFPKCRGRGKWSELDEKTKAKLQADLDALERANPVPRIETLDGRRLTDEKGKPVEGAPKVEELVLDADPRTSGLAVGSV
jgi:DNA topoisomerase-1